MTLVTENLKTYRVFISMHNRCKNTNYRRYADYGGRGIKVCPEWTLFANFLADMGPQPEGMVLDRTDNSGGYQPGNCQWVTPKTSARNTRRNRMVTAFGQTACVSEWAERTGINKTTIVLRLNRGWSPEAALTVSTSNKQNAAMAQLAPILQQLAPLLRQAGLTA